MKNCDFTPEEQSRLACYKLGTSLVRGHQPELIRVQYTPGPNYGPIYASGTANLLEWKGGNEPGASLTVFGPLWFVGIAAIADRRREARRQRANAPAWRQIDSGIYWLGSYEFSMEGQQRGWGLPYEKMLNTETDHHTFTMTSIGKLGTPFTVMVHCHMAGMVRMLIEYLRAGEIPPFALDESLRLRAADAGLI